MTVVFITDDSKHASLFSTNKKAEFCFAIYLLFHPACNAKGRRSRFGAQSKPAPVRREAHDCKLKPNKNVNKKVFVKKTDRIDGKPLAPAPMIATRLLDIEHATRRVTVSFKNPSNGECARAFQLYIGWSAASGARAAASGLINAKSGRDARDTRRACK